MKKTIDQGEFVQAFDDYNRGDSFSIAGRRALFDYLDQLGDDIGQEIELDVIAICCDYSEYPGAYEAMQQYQPEDMPVEGVEGDDLIEAQERNEKAAHEWLEERTTVIDVTGGGVIIQQF
jgi:hypothetical protein